jgi:hypothetical protein
LTTTVNITVIPEHEYKVSLPEGVTASYSDQLVGDSFIAIEGANTLVLESGTVITGNVVVTEILRSFYDADDAQGGIWAYQDAWMSRYSFTPEWMGSVGNRLVSFKNGMPYIHTGANNTFFGRRDDSHLAIVHSDAGNQIKVYRSLAVEGDKPDHVHLRTEIPYVQSSDLVAGDFAVKEGVNYAPVYRDRLSPNATGTYSQKLFTGDTVRGEWTKVQVVYLSPTARKDIKFINIDFDQSTGQTV